MKASRLFSVATVALLLSTSSLLAQQGPNHSMMKGKRDGAQMGNMSRIPNLSEEQKSMIKELHIAHYKETQPIKNQLQELKARQKSLSTADKPDIKAINANIDDITKLQNKLMKSRAAMHQQVRALLNDEQKMWFDQHGKRAEFQKGHHGMMRGKRGMEPRCENTPAEKAS
jgi:hypothetical protein